MNREIKFRAWHIAEEKMCAVELINFEKGAFLSDVIPNPDQLVEIGDKTFKVIAPERGRLCDFAEIHLMQYMGIEDKNGVKIFDGDLVMLEHYKSSDLFDYEKPFIVTYEYGQVNFKQRSYNNFIGSFVGKLKIEVIGNLYENPELIKEQVS